jgi:D-glycero-beta-D-manno-heptose-7-phosphate kinase
LGGNAVLVGVTGKDTNAENLFKVLDSSLVNSQFVIRTKEFQTTTKVRVLAGQQYAPRQQVIRIDYENPNSISSEVVENLKSNLIAASEDSDAIVVSDYNYGVASSEIYEVARKLANEKNIPLVVDSRFRLENFPGATSATPNKEEVEQLLGNELTVNSCIELCRKLNNRSLLVTLGNKGMLLVEAGKEPVKLDCIGSSEPIDVTGAGDTVIAAYTLGLASGLGFAESAAIANHAGGIVVMKKGTASVSSAELLRSIEENH